ncbi:MAG: hypothetical protein ACP5QP_07025 [Brevinematia bacterium]
MMKSSSGSALVIVLMMVFVLSVVSISVLNFISFYYFDTSFLYEREKLKLIYNKEILEVLEEVKNGIFNTNVILRTNTDNFYYKVSREFKTNNNFYEVILVLQSPKARLVRKLKFYILFPTDFSYINFSKVIIGKDTKGVVWGYSFIGDINSESDNFFFAYSYPPIFSSTSNLFVRSYISDIDLYQDATSINLRIKYQTNFVNVVDFKVPIEEMINKSLSLVSKDWIINSYEDYEDILNPLLTEKEFLGKFSYSRPYLFVKSDKIDNIYFSEKVNKFLNPLESSDAFGSRGEISKMFFKIEKNYLTFVSYPVRLLLSPSSFSKKYEIVLNDSNVKFVSPYRKVVGVFFDSTNENVLNRGVILDKGILKIKSEEIKDEYYLSLGVGDGVNKSFSLPKDVNPQKVFVGDEEVSGYYVENYKLILPYPPKNGDEVVVLKKLPTIFIQKAFPRDGINVFADKFERAEVIDFDRISNLPKNGIIFSFLPLVLRGSPNEPVVVVSKENIYLDKVNTIENTKSLFVVSAKGVFLKEDVEVLKDVFIVSQLDGLYRVSSFRADDISNERDKWITGTLVLTGRLKNYVLSGSRDSYIFSYENPMNNSTIVISKRLAKDYLSDTVFGKNVRYIIPFLVRLVSY